jgi:hypothetical protein
MILRPRHDERDFFVEHGKEHFVEGIEARHEELQCSPRVHVGRHAAADVEEDTETDGRAIRTEVRNRPARAAINQLELIGGQVPHESPRPIGHRNRHDNQIGFRAEDGEILGVGE